MINATIAIVVMTLAIHSIIAMKFNFDFMHYLTSYFSSIIVVLTKY